MALKVRVCVSGLCCCVTEGRWWRGALWCVGVVEWIGDLGVGFGGGLCCRGRSGGGSGSACVCCGRLGKGELIVRSTRLLSVVCLVVLRELGRVYLFVLRDSWSCRHRCAADFCFYCSLVFLRRCSEDCCRVGHGARGVRRCGLSSAGVRERCLRSLRGRPFLLLKCSARSCSQSASVMEDPVG